MSVYRYPIRLTTIWYKEASRSYTSGAHVHRVHQWYCLLRGSIKSTIDGETFLLRPGESLIIRPGSTREHRCVGKAPAYLFAIFRNIRLELDAIANRPIMLPRRLQEDLYDLVGELRRPGTPNATDVTTALVVRLLVGLIREGTPRTDTRTGMSCLNTNYYKDVVRQVETYIQRNLHERIMRSDMAAAVNMSEPHLARVFRQTTGKTLGERLTDFRIEYSKSLLLESTMPITTIAMEAGFQSFSHFTQLFRREVGVCPSDYRRAGGRNWR